MIPSKFQLIINSVKYKQLMLKMLLNKIQRTQIEFIKINIK
jgi:hypothetical protein